MIRLTDKFFAPRQLAGLKSTIPSSLKRCEETGRLKAFNLQWKEGDPDCPHIYWDSDVAKVMEGMALVGKLFKDEEILRKLDELTALVISAQQADGYLNTHFTVVDRDKRWNDLYDCHELYCAGHLIEAAVARFEATGKRDFLDAMCRYADYICREFGPDGKPGYPGHEELELALVKLYRATGEKRYLHQAKLFIDRRGTMPNWFLHENVKYAEYRDLENRQAHKPVREQSEAVGHAVRAVYLYSGMTDVAFETDDTELLEVCKTLFEDIVNKKMYITGGIGARQRGESFGVAYELQAQNAYAESCAAIGMVFFASRLLKAVGDARYADAVERLIFNGAVSGLSLEGNRFFYSNPQERSLATGELGHIKRQRQPWYSTSCCPTSYCRFLPQLGNFCYRTDDQGSIAIDIPVSAEVKSGNAHVKIESGYPYGGNVRMTVLAGELKGLSIRIPGWCKNYKFSVPGKIDKGYWSPDRFPAAGETIQMDLEITTEIVYPSARISALRGMAALCRGPLVYCIESTDIDGRPPTQLSLPVNQNFTEQIVKDLPEGTIGICGYGFLTEEDDVLYSFNAPKSRKIRFTAIPYALWQNRGDADMSIFFPIR